MVKRLLFPAIAVFLFPLLSFRAEGAGEEGPWAEPDRLFGFAMHLFQEKDWYRAVTEFKRFLLLYPQDPRGKEALLHMGVSYGKEGDWESAVKHLRQCALRYPDDPIGRRALLEMGEVYFEAGRFGSALAAYEEVVREQPDSEEAHSARYRMGWSYLKMGRFRQALELFESIGPSSPYGGRSSDLAARLRQMESSPLPHKDPAIAGILSAVLPGAGHVYCGEFRDGWISFSLNAVFLAGAIASFRSDHPVLGGILSFFELGWYLGGIYTAQQAAKRYNERAFKERLLFLEGVSLRIDPREGMGFLAVRLSF